MTTRAKLFSQLAKSVDASGTITSDGISSTVSLGATVYDSIGELPTSGYTAGEQAFVKSTSRLYINSGVGWYNVAVINNTPTIQSVLDSDGGTTPFALAADGTATTITITAQDSDGDTLTYTAVTDSDFGGLATVSQADNVFTITPFSQDSATTESGTITFNVSDGINIANSLQTFTIEFLSGLWGETVLSIGTSSTDGLDNSTFIDRSTNAHTASTSGTPIQTEFHPYHENWSVEFDGSGDYLQTNTSENLSGDFTIECWVWHVDNGATANPSQRVFTTTTGGNISANLQIIIGNSTGGGVYNGAPYVYSNTFLPVSDESITEKGWHHIAVTRDGSDVKLFVNGVQKGSTVTNSTSFALTNSFIGTRDVGVDNDNYSGYISDLRVVNGTALYTTNFTPPTEKLTAVSGTSLLTCQSNRFIDNSTNDHTITVNGDPRVSAFNPFGQGSEYAMGENKGSFYGDATGGWVGVNPFGVSFNSDWTLEAWVYYDATPVGSGIVSSINQGSGVDGIYFLNASDFYITTNGSSWGMSYAADAYLDRYSWHHCALSWDGTTYRAFVDGTVVSTYASSSAVSISGNAIGIGATSTGTGDFGGYISDYKLTIGTAKYTSNFAVPTSPVGNTDAYLYLPMDNAGIFDKTGMNTVTLFGDTSTSTTQTKFADTAMYFDGSGDYITTNFPALGTGDFTIEFWINPSTIDSTFKAIIDPRTSNANNPLVWIRNNNVIYYYSSGGERIVGTTTLSTSTWYHVTLCRSSGTTKLFLNGTQEGSDYSDTTSYTADTLFIGQRFNASPTYYYHGYIENLQVLKGVAKYTSNFTPPTQEQGRSYQAES